jgi:uncharacterized membrane protein YecN with MAPEG domain
LYQRKKRGAFLVGDFMGEYIEGLVDYERLRFGVLEEFVPVGTALLDCILAGIENSWVVHLPGKSVLYKFLVHQGESFLSVLGGGWGVELDSFSRWSNSIGDPFECDEFLGQDEFQPIALLVAAVQLVGQVVAHLPVVAVENIVAELYGLKVDGVKVWLFGFAVVVTVGDVLAVII